MAAPAAIALAVRAALAAATDKRTWKIIGIIIAAVLTPFILVIVIIMTLLSEAEGYNSIAVETCFSGGIISPEIPEDYAGYIRDMKKCFTGLDATMDAMASEIEEGSLDRIRVKAVFYSLYFGSKNLNPDSSFYHSFIECFVEYEKKTRTVKDKNGNDFQKIYAVAVPVTSLTAIYGFIGKEFDRMISLEERDFASEIYDKVLDGESKKIKP